MFLSVFDMFKVGIGPSSSHTMGPMVAAARFLDHLRAQPFRVAGLRASLHRSLAFTRAGHASARATTPRPPRPHPARVAALRASLRGSLAFPGVGPASDRATILGLAGFTPEGYDAER